MSCFAMTFICGRLGIPGVSGLALMSNLSVSNHAGALTICLGCRSQQNVMRSARWVLIVFNMPVGLTPIPQAFGRPGSAGLIVATSNCGFAFASIIFGGGGGSGIVHAVVGVALARINGRGWPWVHV